MPNHYHLVVQLTDGGLSAADARAERLLLALEQLSNRSNGHRAPLEEPVPITRR